MFTAEAKLMAQDVAKDAIKDEVHRNIVRNLPKIEAWFRKIRTEVDVPFYSSYDIRDAGFKVTNVDANIYPAGFNNICPTDRENCPPLIKHYIERHYGAKAKRILLLTEEHTNNPYYWDNVTVLQQLMREAGLDTRIGVPRANPAEPFNRMSASYGEIQVYGAQIEGGKITVAGFEPDVVISNNDFSEFYAEWGEELALPMNPPRELGWYRRKKSTYFKHYNQLVTEFANMIEVDPWLFTVETELYENFDMGDESARATVAAKVDEMLARMKANYLKRGITDEPVLFMKNNSGTYGLAVMRVQSGAEVMALNNKSRKKMKAAKGGRDVEEVILQEGVPSIVKADGNITAEPAIYLVGCQLAGGFLRTHQEKSATESLNSPGAVYKRLCVSDLKVSVEGHPMENVYGWIARIGLLAIGLEGKEMGVTYKGYTRWQEC